MIIDVVLVADVCHRWECYLCARDLRINPDHDCKGTCADCRQMNSRVAGLTLNGRVVRGIDANRAHEHEMVAYYDAMYERMDEPEGLEWELTP